MSLRNTPVLVIGGLGFIGINLTRRLLADGAAPTVLTPSRARHAGEAAALERAGARVVEGDLRDAVAITTAVRDQQVVINLSGQSGAVRSMEDPWTDLDVNCRGNLVVLEALREVNRDAKMVFAGSRLQYGHADVVPVAEDAPSEPLCLHAIHKRTVEQYLRLYGRLFGIRHATARITNPYGPGQPAGRTAYGVINRMIHLALSDQAIAIYGDGAQLRDYIHVDDVVAALVALAESPAADGQAFNVGSGTGTGLAEVARLVIEIAGGGRLEHVEWPDLARQIETGDFVADISKIARVLGWTPTQPLRPGLAGTIAHYRSQIRS
jgi:UDP-glucose 4-epimerase